MSYEPGTWNALCMRCGFKYKANRLRKEPETGLRVCRTCYDPRHPQDSVRGKADRQAPPWTSPEPADVFVSASVTQDDL